jgi:hypothetical protein
VTKSTQKSLPIVLPFGSSALLGVSGALINSPLKRLRQISACFRSPLRCSTGRRGKGRGWNRIQGFFRKEQCTGCPAALRLPHHRVSQQGTDQGTYLFEPPGRRVYTRPVPGEKRREPRRGGVVERGFWLLLPVKVTRRRGPEPPIKLRSRSDTCSI